VHPVSFNVLNTNVNSKQIQLSFRYQGLVGLPYIYISGFIQDVSFVNIVNLDTSNPINGGDIFVVGCKLQIKWVSIQIILKKILLRFYINFFILIININKMQTNLLHQPENETLYYHTGTGSI
jgi:hypothetical protein